MLRPSFVCRTRWRQADPGEEKVRVVSGSRYTIPFSLPWSLTQPSYEPVLGEQIELLCRYQLERAGFDPELLGRHARMIVRLAR